MQVHFRAYSSNGQVAVVLEKVFVWLYGKFWEEAVMKEDRRIINVGEKGWAWSKFLVLEHIPGTDIQLRKFY